MLYVMPIGRANAHAAIDAAGDGWRVKVEAPKRSLDQNSAVHPIVREIAHSAGQPTDTKSLTKLRYLLLEAWRNETHRQPMYERSLDGMRMVNVDGGTSDLDKPDCSEFLDWLQAWRALHETTT